MERAGGTVDFEAVIEKFLREESGLGRVGLWVGQDVSVRRGVLEVFDVVVRCLPAVVEKLLAIFGGRIEDGHGCGDHILDGVVQVPPSALPRVGVEGECFQVLRGLGKLIDGIEARGGIAVERRLGKERNLIPEYVQ